MEGYELVKRSPDGKWAVLKREGSYFFEKQTEGLVKTPGGVILRTIYPNLADRILQDLTESGEMNFSADSILPWHYTMVENFSRMDHEDVERLLEQSFLLRYDWTFSVRTSGTKWAPFFGKQDKRLGQIKEWLSKCTHMQMTAACCIGNAYHSINMSFVLALLMETYSGEERESAFEELADFVSERSEYYATVDDFKTFELYYGIHLEEYGPLLEEIVSIDAIEEADDFEMADLEGAEVSVATLVGRNYYHYSDCILDTEQPMKYMLPDLDLDNLEEEEEKEEEAEDNDDDNSDLEDYLPDDCWVKRFVDEDDPRMCYLAYLTLDEDGCVGEVGCLT